MRIMGLFEWNSVEGRGGTVPRSGGCPLPLSPPTDSVAITREVGGLFLGETRRGGRVLLGSAQSRSGGRVVYAGLRALAVSNEPHQARLQFGADLVGRAVRINMLDPVGEQRDLAYFAQKLQRSNPSGIALGALTLML